MLIIILNNPHRFIKNNECTLNNKPDNFFFLFLLNKSTPQRCVSCTRLIIPTDRLTCLDFSVMFTVLRFCWFLPPATYCSPLRLVSRRTSLLNGPQTWPPKKVTTETFLSYARRIVLR